MNAAISPGSAGPLGRILLITGSEEFLAERAVQAARAAVRAIDPEAEFSETTGSELTLSNLAELSAPSLFSSTRCVLVRQFENLPAESVDELLGYAAAPADDVALVLVHSGGAKGSGTLTKLRKVPTVSEHKTAPLKKAAEFATFAINEARAHQVRLDSEAASFLVQAVGQDLRSLAAAASQLANDFEGKPVTTQMVQQYFGGRAEVKSFTIAEHVLAGKTTEALEELRWGLERGIPVVLVTSALASNMRQLAQIRDTGQAAGVPPWKVEILRRQARGWTPAGVAAGIRLVAKADADIKGQVSDAPYALEQLLMQLAQVRRR